MSAYDHLERQLRHSVAARRRRLRFAFPVRARVGEKVLVAAGVAVAIVVAVVAVVALGHGKRATTQPMSSHYSNTPPPHPLGEVQYILDAQRRVFRQDPGCDAQPTEPPRATNSDGSPSEAMLSTLGVLRRPATARDSLPSGTIGTPGEMLGRGVDDIYIRYVRLARVVDGVSYYIVPAGKVGFAPTPVATLKRCEPEYMAALREMLAKIPKKLRPSTLRYAAWLFNAARIIALEQPIHEGVFQLSEEGNGGGESSGGDSPSMIRADGFLGELNTTFDVVVPDGVASLTLHFPAGSDKKERLPAINLTSNVIGNVAVIKVPDFGADRNWPSTMTWRAPTGRIIKVVDEEQFHP